MNSDRCAHFKDFIAIKPDDSFNTFFKAILYSLPWVRKPVNSDTCAHFKYLTNI